MSRITAADCSFPESPGHLLSADVAPVVLDISLIHDLVQHHRLLIALPPLLHPLTGQIRVDPLHRTMRDPRPCVVIHLLTVVNGTQMAVHILLTDDRRIPLPVRQWFLRHQVIFIGQRPPHIPVGRKSRDHILPVQIVLLFRHHGESPSVVRMHHDQIRLDPKLHQILDPSLQMGEVLRIEPPVIPVIARRASIISVEILRRQHRTVAGRTLIWIAVRLPQIVVIMFREDAKTDLVKSAVL